MSARIARLIAAIAFAVGIVALLAGCTTKVVTAPAGPQIGTVTAQGTGSVSAIPDQALMSFGVSASDKDAKAALDKVSAQADKVIAALKAAGVAEKDIQTANVSVFPQYGNQLPGSSAQAPIIGYQASLSVTAKVRDLGSLSKVIGAASAAHVDNINGPTFSIAEDSVYRQAAITKAVADARVTATSMAKAAGKSLGEVLSITSNAGATPVPRVLTEVAPQTGSATSVPVQPGQLDVNADVTVVFALK